MAKDIYHQIVRKALEKDGWVVTHDPFRIPKNVIGAKLEIDLGLERIIVAEKDTEKIVVEVKSFLKTSLIHEFHGVLGQYLNYEIGLEKINSNRQLYLAIPKNTFEDLLEMPLFEASVEKFEVKIIVFEPEKEIIVQWKK
jgi:XisH protein